MDRVNISIRYDKGIEISSEWPEYIADRIDSCSIFVLFVSEAYMASNNCKRELNYAISHDKRILTVHIEDVALPGAMELQLGLYQALMRSSFPDDEKFHLELCGAA